MWEGEEGRWGVGGGGGGSNKWELKNSSKLTNRGGGLE